LRPAWFPGLTGAPSARRRGGNHGSRVTARSVRELCPGKPGRPGFRTGCRRRGREGGKGGGHRIPSVGIGFPDSICFPSRAVPPAAGMCAGLFCITKEPACSSSSSSSRRPAPPHLAFPRPAVRVPSRNWLPGRGSRYPEGGGGRGGNNWAGAGETRGSERQDREGAVSPGRAALPLARTAPPAAADWRMLKFGLKAPEEVF
jgi:hypothetical protein